MDLELLKIPQLLLSRLDLVYSFILIFVRFTAFFLYIPGLGGGQRGMLVRAPSIFVLTVVTLMAGKTAPLPADWGAFTAACCSDLQTFIEAQANQTPLTAFSLVQDAIENEGS